MALEAYDPLRARLRVTANDHLFVRGDRIIVSWLPHASNLTCGFTEDGSRSCCPPQVGYQAYQEQVMGRSIVSSAVSR
jgi:hypothetical protein